MFPWKERRRILLLRFGEFPEITYSWIREAPRCCSTICNWRDSPAPSTTWLTPLGLYASCCAHTFCEEQNKSTAEELAGVAEMLLLLQVFLVFLWAEGRRWCEWRSWVKTAATHPVISLCFPGVSRPFSRQMPARFAPRTHAMMPLHCTGQRRQR